MSDIGLVVFLTFFIWFTIHSLMASNVTQEEQKEMLKDEEMWP